MHKTFYASGFLYHLPSQQILLQQHSVSPVLTSPWFLFGGSHTEKEEPEKIFKSVIYNRLHIKVDTIQTVYSYFNENTNSNQAIVYTKLEKFQNFPTKNGLSFAWFSFKDVTKLYISEQTKHDIIVGQRVIDATARKSRGEHTFQ